MRFSPLITVLSAISVNLSSATTIYEIGQSDEDFSTLVSLVEAAGLAETLSSEDKLTLFAPPNEAFAALDDDLIDWLGENMDALTSVLLYHVVAGKFLSSDLVFGNLTTVEGSNVTVSLNPSPMINDANVTEADTKASNGVIHVIDGVLIPQSVLDKYAASLEPETIFEIGQSDEDFSILVSLVEAAGLAETLSSEGPLTLFAPPNEAFGALDQDLSEWLGENADALSSVLLYHVVAGSVFSTDLVDGNVMTAEGSDVEVSLDLSMINDANIIEADVVASNGVIHVIDAVLVPKTVIDGYVASLEPMKSAKKSKKGKGKKDSKKNDSKHDKKAKKDDSKKSKKHDKKSKRN